MLKSICRSLGFLCLAITLVAGVLDVIHSIDASSVVLTPLGVSWLHLDIESFNLTQNAIQKHLHPYFWDPIMLWILELPTFFVFFVLAMIFYGLGRRRKSRYDNYRI